MGHHWPAGPAGPAALPGRAPVLLAGESPRLLILAFLCVNYGGSSNLVLAFIAAQYSDQLRNPLTFREFKVMCLVIRITFLGFHKSLSELHGLKKNLWFQEFQEKSLRP